jgi:hypothetical protein
MPNYNSLYSSRCSRPFGITVKYYQPTCRLKNEEEEVEKFVMANTQELAKDKWLCPLSGK